MKTTQHKAMKSETVAERAVRGALAGYIHAERTVIETRKRFQVVTAGTPPLVAVIATVEYTIRKAAIDTMLRRERAASKKKGKK